MDHSKTGPICPGFKWLKQDGDHAITKLKKRPENGHLKMGRSGFRMLTVDHSCNRHRTCLLFEASLYLSGH
jgi:hypothetical protein